MGSTAAGDAPSIYISQAGRWKTGWDFWYIIYDWDIYIYMIYIYMIYIYIYIYIIYHISYMICDIWYMIYDDYLLTMGGSVYCTNPPQAATRVPCRNKKYDMYIYIYMIYGIWYIYIYDTLFIYVIDMYIIYDIWYNYVIDIDNSIYICRQS